MLIRHQVPLSVIIPCLNCENTIDRAVNSVFQQTWLPKEVFLIADDGNTDGTLSKMKEIEATFGSSWIKVLELKDGDGPSSARNYGWQAANQPFIAFLDADDAWHPRKVEIQLKYMQDHSQVAITCHLSSWLREEDSLPPLLPEDYSINVITKKMMLVSNQVVTSTVMLKRNLNFRFEPTKRHSEDYLLWLQILYNKYRAEIIELHMAYSYKPPYGSSGLSSQLWDHEMGELDSYKRLFDEHFISWPVLVTLSSFSIAKYVRRIIISKLRSMRG